MLLVICNRTFLRIWMMYNRYLIVITFLCMYTCVYYESCYIHTFILCATENCGIAAIIIERYNIMRHQHNVSPDHPANHCYAYEIRPGLGVTLARFIPGRIPLKGWALLSWSMVVSGAGGNAGGGSIILLLNKQPWEPRVCFWHDSPTTQQRLYWNLPHDVDISAWVGVWWGGRSCQLLLLYITG